jgi:tetratricopeptide (TPR) repeat protein
MTQAAALAPHPKNQVRDPDRELREAVRLLELGKTDAARRQLERILAGHPEHTDSLNHLGAIAWHDKNLPLAFECFRHAVRLDSENPMFLRNLGNVLFEMKIYDHAAAAFGLVTRLEPQHAKSWHGLALSLRFLEYWDEAIAAGLRSIRLDPTLSDAFDNLAVVLVAQGDFDRAIQLFKEAVRIAPRSFSAWNNLGNLLIIYQRPGEAAEAFRKAIALKGDYPELHMHLGMALMQMGDFAAGLPEYEWRWRGHILGAVERPASLPRWDGGAAPRRILLHAEQGLGDGLQFCRYAPMVAARGHHVVLEVHPELASLIGYSLGSEAIEVVPRSADYPGISTLPPVDAHCPLMSLPLIMGTTPETIPGDPYLRADPALVGNWRERLAAALPAGGLRVGLVWAGNPRKGQSFDTRGPDARRSMPLATLAALFDVPGTQFISLQKGEGAEQLRAARDLPVYDADPLIESFADTAALVANLDLVICVDTSVCHLVGGMGRPVWMLSRFDSCWRWFLKRTDSPWYPSMRIFRQRADRSWERVVADVRRALQELVDSRARG